MIVFIDLRHADGRTLHETTARFGFFDTERCCFVRLGMVEAWSCWDEFVSCWEFRYHERSPYQPLYELADLRRACGARTWVFKDANPIANLRGTNRGTPPLDPSRKPGT